MSRPKVLLISPLSGAISGQEAVTRMILDSPLVIHWDISHVDAWTSRGNAERGWPSWGSLRRFTKLLWTVRQAAREVKPQVAWIPMGSNRAGFLKFALLAQSAQRKGHGVRIIGKYGGDAFREFYIAQGGPVRDLIRNVLGRCAAVLVEADCLTHQFAGLLPSDRVRFAHLGLDPGPAPLPHRSRPARNILFLGHITRAKGAVDLLAAMPAVTKAIPGARLVLLGEHLRRERNVVQVHDRDAGWRAVKARPANVEAPGILTGPAKRHALAEADVFCLPSASEGFPVSVLEAMAAGLPLVTTTAGALKEILKPDIHTKFVPFGNPAVLARTLIELLHHDARFQRVTMGRAVREEVETKYTLETFATGVQYALRDVIR